MKRRCENGLIKTLLLLALLASALGACAAGLPRPLPESFVSPIDNPFGGRERHVYYFPMLLRAPNKLGMAGCPATPESMTAFGGAWCYSWCPDPGAPAGYEAVPMIWGASDVRQPVGGNSAWLMGFNEPDLTGQANLSPEAAARLWRDVERRHPDRKLVAPAPSHLHPEWLPQFRAAYRQLWGAAPRLDALALHCYLQRAEECLWQLGRFEAWAREWAPAGQPPLEVWVTEFAFMQSFGLDAERQAREFIATLERDPLVQRYAPYVSRQDCARRDLWDCSTGDPSLLTADGALTDIGEWYAKPPCDAIP